MNALACPSCSTVFHVDDLNESLAIAKCHSCRQVIDLRNRPEPKQAMRERPHVATPPRFTITEEPGRFEVSWGWRSGMSLFLIVFCLFWDTFMAVWFTIAISSGAWGMALFGSLHAAVGVGLTYFTLCSFINRTRLTVDHGQLHIKHGPLPWPGGGTLQGTDINQLFCVETVSRGRNLSTVTWELHALKRDGEGRKLVGGLETKDQVFWLERVLEGRLGIVDTPVPGEVTA